MGFRSGSEISLHPVALTIITLELLRRNRLPPKRKNNVIHILLAV